MLQDITRFDKAMIQELKIEELQTEEIKEELEKYLNRYTVKLSNKSQRNYFSVYIKGVLSDLDRKSIEPIALTFMGEGNIRGFQQFFKRGKMPDQKIKESYQEALSEALSAEGGMLCVDGSDFVKKGSDSVGVYRQHCGRLGKTENCQAGVFSSYVSKKGVA